MGLSAQSGLLLPKDHGPLCAEWASLPKDHGPLCAEGSPPKDHGPLCAEGSLL